MSNQCDIIVRNGTIVDGTGTKKYVGDVIIIGSKIVEVGRNVASKYGVPNKYDIDATGKIVCPGWTDVHTHYDAQAMWDPLCQPSGPAGVTTVITGNCGVGCAPTRNTKKGRDFMVNTLGVIEDIPGDVLRQGIKWKLNNGKPWESFPEYLQCMEELNFACDIGALIPHSQIRPWVLGEDRAALADLPGGPFKTPILETEKKEMAAIVKEAIEAGALGFSTNRFYGHRDGNNTLAAGTLADVDEVVYMAKAMAEAGGGMLEMHNDFRSYDDIPEQAMDPKLRSEHAKRENKWIHFVAREYGLPINWLGGVPPEVLNRWQMNDELIYNQMLVRPQSMILSFPSRFHPFTASKTLRTMKSNNTLTYENLVKSKTIIIEEVKNVMKQDTRVGKIIRESWNDDNFATYYPITETFDYEPATEESILNRARKAGTTCLEYAYDHMLTKNASGVIWNGNSNNVTDFYEARLKDFSSPYIVPGISDAGAHLAIFQDGTTPTSMISFWARDRKKGHGFTLEYAVKKQARDTAYMYGLTDRGTLEKGKKADLNIIDFDHLHIHHPELVHDLPTGAPRWSQKVTGYDFTILSGEITFENGKHTGVLPGKLVKNPRHLKERIARRMPLPDVPDEFKGYRKNMRIDENGSVNDMDTMLQASLNAESGISNASRIANVLEEEQRSKL